MLMTTLLLSVYLRRIRKHRITALIFLLFFGTLEGTFFLSSLSKFRRGGYVALFMAALLFGVMLVWYRGRRLRIPRRFI